MQVPFIDPDSGEILAIEAPFVRTRYNYNRRLASMRAALETPEPTLTQQQFAEQSDINTIVKNFGLTGQLPKDVAIPLSGDFEDMVTDYQTALNLVMRAEESFMQFPAEVRARFDNDPQRLQEFVENPANRDEARTLGLLVPEPSRPLPVEVRVLPEPSAPPPPAPKGA